MKGRKKIAQCHCKVERTKTSFKKRSLNIHRYTKNFGSAGYSRQGLERKDTPPRIISRDRATFDARYVSKMRRLRARKPVVERASRENIARVCCLSRKRGQCTAHRQEIRVLQCKRDGEELSRGTSGLYRT